MALRSVVSLLCSLLAASVACGGEVSSIGNPPPASDGGRARGDAARDAEHDTEPNVESGNPSCGERPTFPDGGEVRGCIDAVCPSGTVCVEVDGDIGLSVPVSCVTIPAACAGSATCSCMGTIGYECDTHSDTPPGPGEGCEDGRHGDASYIVFSCLACDGLGATP